MPAHKEILQIITPELYAEMNKAEEISDNQIVTVASDIVKNAQQNLSLNAARILRVLYTLINQNDVAGRTYRFDLQSYASAFGLSNAKIYRVMTESCKELRDSFILPLGKGRVTGLIERAQVTDNEVQIMIDPALLTVYKKDKLRLSYKLKNIAGLAYGITFKFYDLLVMKLGDQDEIYFKIGLEDLKEFLEISNKYSVYKDFKRRILVNIVNDINGFRPDSNSRIMENNNCNLHVEFEEEKEARKVVAICFKVTRVKENEIIEAEIIQDFTDTLTEQESFAYNWLRDQLKIAPYVLQNCIKDDRNNPEEACFLKIYDYIVYMLTDEKRASKIRNKSAWAANCLRKKEYNEVVQRPSLFDCTGDPRYATRIELLKAEGIYDSTNLNDIILANESMLKESFPHLVNPDSYEELAYYSEMFISTNIEYINTHAEYKKKVGGERKALVFDSIRKDYAGFIADTKKNLEKEQQENALAVAKEKFESMSIEELTAYEGPDKEIAKAVLDKKQEELFIKQEEIISRKYNDFLENGQPEEKERIKRNAINNFAAKNKFFTASITRYLVNNGYSGEMIDAPFELLMGFGGFSTFFKLEWKNSLDM